MYVNLHTLEAWWRSTRSRDVAGRLVIVGARKTGKSTWFRKLAESERGRTTYWDTLPVARSSGTEEVWGILFELLGTHYDTHNDPADSMDNLLAQRPDEDITLVVDNWDLSLESSGATDYDACYEVLDALVRYSLDQPGDHRLSYSRLRVVFITSLLDPVELQTFARSVRRPSFERLSGAIARYFAVARIPFLDREDSYALARSIGCPPDLEEELVERTGGWIWLLIDGSTDGCRSQRALREIVADAVQESTLRRLAIRPEVVASQLPPIQYLTMKLSSADTEPPRFGLPSSFESKHELAPAIAEYFGQRILIVDTENIRMPLQKAHSGPPNALDEYFAAVVQPAVQQWIKDSAHQYSVKSENIYLVGRSRGRIDQTVGASFQGVRLFLPDTLREKARRRRDSTDDALLIASVAQMQASNPLAEFIVLTGDMDIPLILKEVGADQRMRVRSPWSVSAKLRKVYAPEIIETFTFPLDLPKLPSGAQ